MQSTQQKRRKQRTARYDERRESAVQRDFEPKFWRDRDGRLGLKREIQTRYRRLKKSLTIDTPQKDFLLRRVVWLSIQLETMECSAADTGKFDEGIYTQMLNSFTGLLAKLGLDAKPKKARNLRELLDE